MLATDDELDFVHDNGMDHVTYILIGFRFVSFPQHYLMRILTTKIASLSFCICLLSSLSICMPPQAVTHLQKPPNLLTIPISKLPGRNGTIGYRQEIMECKIMFLEMMTTKMSWHRGDSGLVFLLLMLTYCCCRTIIVSVPRSQTTRRP